MMTRGAFCISIDLELAWGIWDKPSPRALLLCAEKERTIVRELLATFDRWEVAVTWAIVGRLLERDPSVVNTTQYGELIWYAPDLIEDIRSAVPKHDIGSHGFAHVYYDQNDRQTVAKDLHDAWRVHRGHGLDFSSFVFPRNRMAHLDVLRETGVRVFRSMDIGWHMWTRRRFGNVVGRAANLADKILPVPPALVEPKDHNGLVELASSMLLFGRDALRRAIHPLALRTKAGLGLESARRQRRTFHLWFHPSNFYHDTTAQFEVLNRILRRAIYLRDKGELDIRPMSSFCSVDSCDADLRKDKNNFAIMSDGVVSS
jgi:hypothetical protein